MDHFLLVLLKMMKAEYLMGLLSFVALAGNYYLVAQVSEGIGSHNVEQYAHPEQAKKLMTLEAKTDGILKDVQYNRERGDLIQKQNTDAHERQEELLKAILQKLDQ